MTAAAGLADLIGGHRFNYRNETELQDALEDLFTASRITAEREVRLCGADRIDFRVGRVGVEVKTQGPVTTVLRQLQRYAHSDMVDGLLLVTVVAQHLTVPTSIGGKPLDVVFLGMCL